MRLSSDLPPAGFTHAEPSPPRRPRLLAIAVALVLSAGLVLAIGYGTTPARTMTPDAATPSPRPRPQKPVPARPPAAASPTPARDTAKAHSPRISQPRTHASHRGRPAPSHGHRRPAAPRRPRETRKPRSARPRAPSWIAVECRRRFPDDSMRRSACVAALKNHFAG